MSIKNEIVIKGARENNLKNIDITIPKNKLVVMTGLSGSGKSSLAFDTIYAEGQRRYVESLSAYARQFLGGSEKPDVDAIEGLSPAISIDQKTTSNNPRSTVGTVTEIYDYLRLLYARVGTAYCPTHRIPIESQSIGFITDKVMELPEGTKITILSPIVTGQKGSHELLLNELKRDGFVRLDINGEIFRLDEPITLAKNKKHDISIVIDRVVVSKEERSRIFDALEVATKHGHGNVIVKNGDTHESMTYSQNHACKICGFSLPDLEPRLFSFNAPIGACEECNGLGVKLEADPQLLMQDTTMSIRDGGIEYFKNTAGTENIEWQRFEILCDYYGIDLDKAVGELTDKEVEIIMKGSKEPISYKIQSRSGNKYDYHEFIEGIGTLIERRYIETTSAAAREHYRKFMSEATCPKCHGSRLNEKALCVQVGGINIDQFTAKNIDDALAFMLNLELEEQKAKIAKLVINEIVNRLTFLADVGLGYLNLNRKAATLSGGEAQRIRLATQIGSQLTGVLYVLDEPSIGLHQRDNEKLIKTLKNMRDLGNTLIVVEHDEDTMKEADWLIDIGPGAGVHGGQVIAQGTPQQVMDNEKSITGQYLKGVKEIKVPKHRRAGNGKKLTVVGAKENNLKNVTVDFPLGQFIAVTGVSGSGKSTLVNEILYLGVQKYLTNPRVKTGAHKEIKGLEFLDKVVNISQEPIGRTPRSNPATYTGAFDDVRQIFSNTTEAKMRGYQAGRFSFNVPGGRCEKCSGDGVLKIEMHFLPDVYVECEECKGKRYNEETLQVKYKGKTIADVLEMTVEDAHEFFSSHPKLEPKLKALLNVGLGYITLGQQATTLSGGEAQRVKLAKELQKRATGKTIYILDEPTTGLHIHDVAKLLDVLNGIVDGGDTVLTIEHNLDVIKVADHVIDMGPEGGDGGGQVIAKGTPEQIAKVATSHTGHFLKKILK